jgi:hypothetical protein
MSVNSTTKKTLKGIGVSLCVVVLLLGVPALLIALAAKPLPLSYDRGGAINVNFVVWGEDDFPANVNRIRLSELNSGTVVWELKSEHSDSQISEFTLRKGKNPVLFPTYVGSYSVVRPQRADFFTLGRGQYKLEVWQGSNVFESILRKRSTVFQIDD